MLPEALLLISLGHPFPPVHLTGGETEAQQAVTYPRSYREQAVTRRPTDLGSLVPAQLWESGAQAASAPPLLPQPRPAPFASAPRSLCLHHSLTAASSPSQSCPFTAAPPLLPSSTLALSATLELIPGFLPVVVTIHLMAEWKETNFQVRLLVTYCNT